VGKPLLTLTKNEETPELVSVKIRLKRMGKIRAPFYRVVVADSRTKRDGRAIEEIGRYVPTQEPSLIEIDSERAQYWLSVGAQPTEQVAALLKVTGDWQKYKGEEGADGTLKVAEPRPDKRALYEAALAAADGKEATEAATPRKAKKDDAPKPDEAKAEPKAKKDDAKKADAPKADEAKAEPKAKKDDAKKADAPKSDDAKAEKKSEEKADEAAAAEVAAESPAEAIADAEAPAAGNAAEAAGAIADGGFGADSAAATEDGAAPEGFTVKGNKDSMKYHVEGSQWYDQTAAEVWFRTAEAAQTAGFEPAGGAAKQSADAGAEIGTDKAEG
jgi:small subunit ribosomal protein S16